VQVDSVRSCIGGFGGGMGGGMCKTLENKNFHIYSNSKIAAPRILKSFGNDGAKVVNNEGGEALKLSMEKGPIVCVQLNHLFLSLTKDNIFSALLNAFLGTKAL